MQPPVHRLLHLFAGPERVASHRLFEWSKDVKITWRRGLASTADVEDTRRTELGLLQQLNGPSIVIMKQDTCTQKSTPFGLDCSTQEILEEICIRCTGHSVPPGHVVLQNYPSFIPKESQYKLSYRWLCAEFFTSCLCVMQPELFSCNWYQSYNSVCFTAVHLCSLKFFQTKLNNVIPTFPENDCLTEKLHLLMLLERIIQIYY